jgi:hypothetical protein
VPSGAGLPPLLNAGDREIRHRRKPIDSRSTFTLQRAQVGDGVLESALPQIRCQALVAVCAIRLAVLVTDVKAKISVCDVNKGPALQYTPKVPTAGYPDACAEIAVTRL